LGDILLSIMYQFPILITVISLAIYQVLSFLVSGARYKYKVKAPATVGNLEFERRYRSHLNYMENVVIFLPLVWIVNTHFSGNFVYILACLAWVVGRIIFTYLYIKNGSDTLKLYLGLGATAAVVVLFIMSIITAFY
jgi:glutathione S-transferase